MDYVQALMIAVGFDDLTVDRIEWTNSYAYRLAMLNKEFLSKYESQKIAFRIQITKYFDHCVICKSIGFCNHRYHEYYIFNIGVSYNKGTKLVTHVQITNGASVEFKDGYPVFNDPNRRIIDIHKNIPEVVDGKIVIRKNKVARVPYMLVSGGTHVNIEITSALWLANFRIDYEGRFRKDGLEKIICGDSMILFGDFGKLLDTQLPDGINRMYIVDNLLNVCKLEALKDVHGMHTKSTHKHCFEFTRNRTEGGENTICYKSYDDQGNFRFWDFSKPIPRDLVFVAYGSCEDLIV
jgi:hypothetical protein